MDDWASQPHDFISGTSSSLKSSDRRTHCLRLLLSPVTETCSHECCSTSGSLLLHEHKTNTPQETREDQSKSLFSHTLTESSMWKHFLPPGEGTMWFQRGTHQCDLVNTQARPYLQTSGPTMCMTSLQTGVKNYVSLSGAFSRDLHLINTFSPCGDMTTSASVQ